MGTHETEVSLEGELGLHRRYVMCTKHPDHKDFISVKDFTLQHLPAGHRDDDVFDLIATLSQLTVRVVVTFTSWARPELHPRSETAYPFYNIRGSKAMRTGSGRIWGVRKYLSDDNPCPCSSCVRSNTPSKHWGRVYIYTATHVVFDSSEGQRAKVTFGYDVDLEHSRVLDGVGEGVVSDLDRDRCVMSCVTCDAPLLDRLTDLVQHYRKVYRKVHQESARLPSDSRLAVVISHPHGCGKMVSVGEWTRREKISDKMGLIDTQYTYSTATCAGSSGAPVYVLGTSWYTLSHSGAGEDGNFSGGGWG
ncbi:unnamed protein product [Lymnaea stagnalis]|uniref:Peptidase S1 domain-containing protein n=1 Tax=Lymnaea stagnalis TaxID=6523 RepID=A0AAV2HU23_LYMST